MQTRVALAASVAALGARSVRSEGADPMGKVLSMLDDLKEKIIGEGEAAARTYKKFFDWCDDSSSEIRNEIATATRKKADLEGTITEKASDAEASTAKIEELGTSISKDSKKLKEASSIREKEVAEFKTSEADLEATIETLGRAMSEIEKGGASFTQVGAGTMQKALQALRTIVDAASFRLADKQRLLGLVQAKETSSNDDDDADDETGAPQGAGYEQKSGGVMDLLENLKEDAEEQLSNLRKAESASTHNFAKLKQSLTDSVKADTDGLNEEKASVAASNEVIATAQGELDTTVKALAKSQEVLAQTHTDCISAASDHEKSVTARTEELGVLAQARKILEEATSGSSLVEQSYSLLQVGARSRSRALANSEVISIVKKLAKEHHSASLAQLASRISAAVRFSSLSHADPFAKIKKLIEGLITKLENEGAAAASEEAYCQEQMAKTDFKQAELQEDIDKLSTRIDKSTSKSVSLKGEVNTLQAELAKLVGTQTEMDGIRKEEHDNYVAATSELKKGLGGVRKALELLRDYYGSAASAAFVQAAVSVDSNEEQPSPPENHAASSGAGGSIISILEVCESDLASGLSKEEMEEANAQMEYNLVTQENKMTKLQKEQDVKYKMAAATRLDKSVSDMQADVTTEKDELAAVQQYYGEVKNRCVAKPDPYEAQKAKRDAEIKGLKTALDVLESETALVQRGAHGRNARRTYLRK